jgi:hypothetical protein
LSNRLKISSNSFLKSQFSLSWLYDTNVWYGRIIWFYEFVEWITNLINLCLDLLYRQKNSKFDFRRTVFVLLTYWTMFKKILKLFLKFECRSSQLFAIVSHWRYRRKQHDKFFKTNSLCYLLLKFWTIDNEQKAKKFLNFLNHLLLKKSLAELLKHNFRLIMIKKYTNEIQNLSAFYNETSVVSLKYIYYCNFIFLTTIFFNLIRELIISLVKLK